MNLKMRSGKAATLLMLSVLVTACNRSPATSDAGTAKALPAPATSGWAAIAKLPDWSGSWSLSETSAKEATEDSFGTDNGRVPLTPDYMKRRADARAARAQNNLSRCLPAGVPGVLTHGIMHEYLFAPGRVVVMFEDGEVRRIYTDGRKHRPLDEMEGSFLGDSIGHWDGEVLVVDTIGFPRGTLFQNYGLTATSNSHLVERIFKNKNGQMQIDSVLNDPKIFAKPYAFSRTFDKFPVEMEEPGCAKGNRDTGDEVDLTPPSEE